MQFFAKNQVFCLMEAPGDLTESGAAINEEGAVLDNFECERTRRRSAAVSWMLDEEAARVRIVGRLSAPAAANGRHTS